MPGLTQDAVAMRPQRIRRATLHDETVARLREMILQGELPPQTRVPEGALCEALGISRTPLREALKVLVSEGLVELRPNRGSIVAPIDPETVQQMFEVLESLDALVGTLAAERIGSQDLKILDDLTRRLEEQHSASDRRGYFETNQRIHRLMVRATHNPVLEKLYSDLGTKIMRARYMANSSVVRWSESVDEHKRLNDALQCHDGAALAMRLQSHTHLTGIAVMRALQDVSGAPRTQVSPG